MIRLDMMYDNTKWDLIIAGVPYAYLTLHFSDGSRKRLKNVSRMRRYGRQSLEIWYDHGAKLVDGTPVPHMAEFNVDLEYVEAVDYMLKKSFEYEIGLEFNAAKI